MNNDGGTKSGGNPRKAKSVPKAKGVKVKKKQSRSNKRPTIQTY